MKPNEKHILTLIKMPVMALALLLAALTGRAQSPLFKSMAQGVPNAPLAMCVFENNLYEVCQTGTNSFGKIYKVMKWNGTMWSSLPSFNCDMNSSITDMLFYKGMLYVAGDFDGVEGVANAVNIIRFNGFNKTWEKVGQGPMTAGSSSKITSLEIFKGELYAAGQFNSINSEQIYNIARFNGFVWRKLAPILNPSDNGTDGPINDLVNMRDSFLYVGGTFNHAGNKTVPRLATWDTTNWTPGTFAFSAVKKMGLFQNKLVVCGIDSPGTSVTNIFIKNGTTWTKSTGGLAQGSMVSAMEEFENELWACGSFVVNGTGYFVVKFDGTQWFGIPLQASNYAMTLKVFRESLVLGGNYTTPINKIVMNHIMQTTKNLARISGLIYYDVNNDCVFNAGDKKLRQRVIQIDNILVNTDTNGIFEAYVSPKTYTVQLLSQKYWSLNNCNTPYYSVTLLAFY